MTNATKKEDWLAESDEKRTGRRAFLGAGLAAGGAVVTAGLARAQAAPDPLITEVRTGRRPSAI
ncbi:MAG: hypothetical protein ACK4NE_10815, partial [Albidovulum sp.]